MTSLVARLVLYQHLIQMLPVLCSRYSKCNKINFKFLSKMNREICSVAPSDTDILQKIRNIVPPLTYNQHKGQSGRIGVIGGSEEYTGAPYFAAISALKLGADLSHVFCSTSAAPVIKSYSPELIVHPILDKANARKEMQQWIPRLHAVVIGPGLGRDPAIMNTVEGIIEDLKASEKPLVIDADGLFMVTQNTQLIKGYKNTILTPNAIEFQRLSQALGLSVNQTDPDLAASMSNALDGVVVAKKQKYDIITDSNIVNTNGSPRRCGGQGDLLSGAAAVFFHWALNHRSSLTTPINDVNPGVLSAYAACLLSKLCAEASFSKMGRSTTTSDLIGEIHSVFQKEFEHQED